MNKVRVGLYGINGHQIHNQMINHDKAEVTAISMIDKEKLPNELITDDVTFYEDFDSLINLRPTQNRSREILDEEIRKKALTSLENMHKLGN